MSIFPYNETMAKVFLHYFPLLASITLLVYANLVLKWQIEKLPRISDMDHLRQWFIALFANLWVLSALTTVLLAGISWVFALTRFPVSYAYPFISLSFLFVVIGGVVILNEKMTLISALGLCFIVVGIVLTALSK